MPPEETSGRNSSFRRTPARDRERGPGARGPLWIKSGHERVDRQGQKVVESGR
jgi:hypothetical protein